MIAGLYKMFDRWHFEGTLHIYSDTHFGDKDLASTMNRPSDEDHVKLINSKVGKNDTLILLGDVGDIEYAKKLKGYKVLLLGNHDGGRTNYERKKWYKKFSKDEYTRNEAIAEMKKRHPGCKYSVEDVFMFSPPFEAWEVCADNCLFDEVYEGPLIIGEKLILSHEPLDISCMFNIHGHTHDKHHKDDDHHFCVCSDLIGYLPVNMNQWMKSGALSKIESIHRSTINKATSNKKARGGKKIGEK